MILKQPHFGQQTSETKRPPNHLQGSSQSGDVIHSIFHHENRDGGGFGRSSSHRMLLDDLPPALKDGRTDVVMPLIQSCVRTFFELLPKILSPGMKVCSR